MPLANVKTRLTASGSGLARNLREMANVTLARKPKFVFIGTGRSGSTFIATQMTEAGIPVSHESYYTAHGPRLRHGPRDWRAEGDSSWCAVPFLPDPEVIAIHQVRHPLKVIESFFKIGFFDAEHSEGREEFVEFAHQHFEFSDDPLRSALRWYLDWNGRCEAITERRFQVEKFDEALPDIAAWIGRTIPLKSRTVPDTINTRAPRVKNAQRDLRSQLKKYPEFDQLVAMAHRYGYAL